MHFLNLQLVMNFRKSIFLCDFLNIFYNVIQCSNIQFYLKRTLILNATTFSIRLNSQKKKKKQFKIVSEINREL
jgi:hypothetical protein